MTLAGNPGNRTRLVLLVLVALALNGCAPIDRGIICTELAITHPQPRTTQHYVIRATVRTDSGVAVQKTTTDCEPVRNVCGREGRFTIWEKTPAARQELVLTLDTGAIVTVETPDCPSLAKAVFKRETDYDFWPSARINIDGNDIEIPIYSRDNTEEVLEKYRIQHFGLVVWLAEDRK